MAKELILQGPLHRDLSAYHGYCFLFNCSMTGTAASGSILSSGSSEVPTIIIGPEVRIRSLQKHHSPLYSLFLSMTLALEYDILSCGLRFMSAIIVSSLAGLMLWA